MSNGSTQERKDDHDQGDFLKGVVAIGQFIGEKPRATNHLLATGKLPGSKIGGAWWSTKSQLRARIRGEG